MGMFEFDDLQRREAIEGQQPDMLRNLATNSDRALQTLKSMTRRPYWKIPKPACIYTCNGHVLFGDGSGAKPPLFVWWFGRQL